MHEVLRKLRIRLSDKTNHPEGSPEEQLAGSKVWIWNRSSVAAADADKVEADSISKADSETSSSRSLAEGLPAAGAVREVEPERRRAPRLRKAATSVTNSNCHSNWLSAAGKPSFISTTKNWR